MVTVFHKSANRRNEMALTICNCLRLMRDWKLGNLANGKQISTVPFDGKSHLLWFVYFQSADNVGHGLKLLQGKEGVVIVRVKSH